MASKTLVLLEDDLHGGKADETVLFGLDGKLYEIDLNEKNANRLRATLAQYVAAGRRGRAAGARGSVRGATAGSQDVAAIRSWAIEQGYEVSARGRIAAGIRDAYAAAR